MAKIFRTFLVVVFVGLGLCSCSTDDDGNGKDEAVDNTIIVYMPWTGSIDNLLSCFQTNISDMKSAIEKDGIPSGNRMVVFLSETETTARLFELTMKNGKCVEKDIRTYTNHPFTTAVGISSILSYIDAKIPSQHYSMIVSGHGMGWVKASTFNGQRKVSGISQIPMKSQDLPLTRYFGSVSADYQTDIATFAEGIKKSKLDLRFILFDDCYMSNIETAYELKDVADYVIGCPTEIMSYGMPYKRILKHLWNTPNYESVCSEMIDFYKHYTSGSTHYPYATIGVVDCSQLDALAADMNLVNVSIDSNADLSAIQTLDGYYPNVFFDLGDYVSHVCHDSSVRDLFLRQLSLAVPYKGNTDYYFTSLSSPHVIKINSFCGVTVSDPSKSNYAADKETTSWWVATH